MVERIAALNGRKEWGGSDPEQLEMFMNGPALWPTKLSQAGDLEKRRKPLIVHTTTNHLFALVLFACDANSNSGMTIGFRVDLKSYVDDENWGNCKILVSQSAHL
jgi:hypothetical protein